ncbi:MAG: deoxyribodipyrimidine photo-lyase [Saprospiraceae bacterium]|nr:deoxyribodipyrimidine photo-lyase [Saprospiraceae bacterium]
MEYAVFWFRRDLRLEDNKGLHEALKCGLPVIPIFIFDPEILTKLSNKKDARVEFIHNHVGHLKSEIQQYGSDLLVFYDTVENVWIKLFQAYKIRQVFVNTDYESYAIKRDAAIRNLCLKEQIQFSSFKDHVLFEKEEVCKEDGTYYSVFTAYKRKLITTLMTDNNSIQFSPYLTSFNTSDFTNFWKSKSSPLVSLDFLGFDKSEIAIPSKIVAKSIIQNYTLNRDYPYLAGTSKLGIHFRFGTISIREKARAASQLNETYFTELMWRDFYSMILQAFPYVEFSSFRPAYNKIEWVNNEANYSDWCEGKTGYPLVDAGMRELNTTGFMHNRLRMVTASFLVKHLLIDWRWGEAYFAEKLLDFDLASNNGGWQWAAGCGTDAAPYFRIFNPQTQQERFDSNWVYIKKWVPEYLSESYQKPIVDHKWARERCLKTFKKALEEK